MNDINKIIGSLSNDPQFKEMYGEAGMEDLPDPANASPEDKAKFSKWHKRADVTAKARSEKQARAAAKKNKVYNKPVMPKEEDKEPSKNVDIIWGATLAAITITKTSKKFFEDIQASFGKLEPQISKQIFLAYKRVGLNKKVSDKKERERITKIISQIADPDALDNFIDRFMTLAGEYNANQIKTAGQLFKINFADEKSRSRLEFFLEEAAKTQNKKYEKASKHLFEILLEGLKEDDGSDEDFVTSIQKFIQEDSDSYDNVVGEAYSILKGASELIDKQLKEVQAEFGAQNLEATKGIAVKNNKNNNQCVANVIGSFSLYTFLVVCLSALTYEAKDEDAGWNRLNKIMINLYNEGVLSSIKGVIAGEVYSFGKFYPKFSSAMGSEGSYKHILSTIGRDTENVQVTIDNLKTQGLITDATIKEVAEKNLLEKELRQVAFNGAAIAKVKQDFTNEKAVKTIIKNIFEASGAKKSKAAKVGTAVGTIAGTVARVGSKIKTAAAKPTEGGE